MKLKIGQIIYYFNGNCRVYKKRQSSPIYEKYFRLLKIVSENNKEYVCDIGTINKRSNKLNIGNDKCRYYTEQEKDDDVFIEENKFDIIEKIRRNENANKLRKIKKIIN